MGRWINADSQINDGIIGKNLFAYCENNPINFVDPYGTDCICLYQRVRGNHSCEAYARNEFATLYAQSEGKSFNFTYEDYTSVHVKKTKTTVTFLERVIEHVIMELVCELVSYASSKLGLDPILVNMFSRVLGYGSLSNALGEGTYPVYTVTWTKYVTRKVAKETFRGGYTIYEDRPFKLTYSISYYFMNGEIVQIQSNGINDEYIAYCYGNRRR